MAMFENFPYTDLHNLNLDWIIKIAKDFLDQYTHIQQLITEGENSLLQKTSDGIDSLEQTTTDGLSQLQTKADNLEALLNEWYNTHSEDIANELADALTDIRNELTTVLSQFNYQADAEIARLLNTIPSDYTELSNKVDNIQSIIGETYNYFNGKYFNGILGETAGYEYASYVIANERYGYTELINIPEHTNVIYIVANFDTPNIVYLRYYDENKIFIQDVYGESVVSSTIPANAVYIALNFQLINLETLFISFNELPIAPLKYGIKEYPNFLRLDQGLTRQRMPTQTKIFPLSSSANVATTYPVKIPNNRTVFFHNHGPRYFTINYYDANGDYITNQSFNGETYQLLTIPHNAVSFLAYVNNAIESTYEYCFIGTDEPIAYVPEFGEIAKTTALKNKKVVMVGDSITRGIHYGGGIPTILNQVYNAVCVNAGHDGFVITRDPNYPNDSLIDVLDNVTGNVDILILSGGINDVSRNYTEGTLPEHTYDSVPNETTFCNALFSYLKMAHTKFPTAKIMYMLTSYKNWNDPTTSERQRIWWDIIRTACNMFSIDIIDLANDSGLIGTTVTGITDTMTETYYHNQDGTHPNWNGYRYLFPYIANRILQHIN